MIPPSPLLVPSPVPSPSLFATMSLLTSLLRVRDSWGLHCAVLSHNRLHGQVHEGYLGDAGVHILSIGWPFQRNAVLEYLSVCIVGVFVIIQSHTRIVIRKMRQFDWKCESIFFLNLNYRTKATKDRQRHPTSTKSVSNPSSLFFLSTLVMWGGGG